MRQPRAQVCEDARGEYRFRILAANNRVIAQGESHPRKRDAERALDTLLDTAVRLKAKRIIGGK